MWTGDSACRVEIARELAQHCSVNAKKDAAAACRYADRAMDVLRQAGRIGQHDLAALRTDNAFDTLRSRADFCQLPRRYVLSGGPIRTVKIVVACGVHAGRCSNRGEPAINDQARKRRRSRRCDSAGLIRSSTTVGVLGSGRLRSSLAPGGRDCVPVEVLAMVTGEQFDSQNGHRICISACYS